MWRPGFRYRRLERARLSGYSRSFCVYSVHHRGSEARPGLVLGLDRGGACEGVAYFVEDEDVAETVSYLREREQVNGVYRETQLPVTLLDNERTQVIAVAYVVERAHPSYASRLPLRVQARIIRGASGLSGDNITYAFNTIARLRDFGIRERMLERLAVLIGPLVANRTSGGDACPHVASLNRAARHSGRTSPQLRPLDRCRFVYRQRLRCDHLLEAGVAPAPASGVNSSTGARASLAHSRR